jgi:hypothetical protein
MSKGLFELVQLKRLLVGQAIAPRISVKPLMTKISSSLFEPSTYFVPLKARSGEQ